MKTHALLLLFVASYAASQPTPEQLALGIPSDIQQLCNTTTPLPPTQQPLFFFSPIQYVNISTGTIAYKTYSSPQANETLPAIILITGFGNTLDNWANSLIQSLANTHSEVIVFDNRAQGLSKDNSPSERLTIIGMANDTAQFIQSLNLSSKPDILGYSMGGMIATALLTNYSSFINTAVVAHGSAGSRNSTLPTRSATQVAVVRNSTTAELGILFDLSEQSGRSEACKHYFDNVYRVAPGNATTTQRQLGAITDYFTVGGVYNYLSTVQNPVYLVEGLDDELVPVDNVRKMAEELPISWLTILPGKHGSLLQYEDVFTSVYEEFLNVWRK